MSTADAQTEGAERPETGGEDESEDENDLETNANQRNGGQTSASSSAKKHSFGAASKLAAVQLAKDTSISNAARAYRTSRSTIQGWLKKAEKLQNLAESGQFPFLWRLPIRVKGVMNFQWMYPLTFPLPSFVCSTYSYALFLIGVVKIDGVS